MLSAVVESYMLHENITAVWSYCRSFTWQDCLNSNFRFFGSCDLDLDPMTFIYELDPYSLEIYWICENKLPTSKLSKVIV